MKKVTVDRDNWWYCEYCGNEIGKNVKDKKEEEKTEKEDE